MIPPLSAVVPFHRPWPLFSCPRSPSSVHRPCSRAPCSLFPSTTPIPLPPSPGPLPPFTGRDPLPPFPSTRPLPLFPFLRPLVLFLRSRPLFSCPRSPSPVHGPCSRSPAMTPSPVNAPLSLSPADDYRPFPRQESLGPFPYRRSFVPSPSVVTFPIEAPTFIRHTSTINRPHPHPRCLVPFLRRNFIIRSPIHVPWSPSPASNHRPLPRPHSLIPSPRWDCIVPCPVDAASSRLHWATIVPSPVHDQSVLPPDDAAPSPPAQVSHRPHKARQCCIVPYTFPSPTGLSSPPHTLVNAPSSVDVPSTVTLAHRGSIIRCTVASLAHGPSSLPLSVIL